MATLTSFLWKTVELNNGTVYGIPLADQGLDDPNSSDATWAYRKGTVPVQTAHSIKEGVFTLNLNLIARHGETAAQYQAKIDQLRVIFDTRDPAFYPLQRKLPHEATYRFLNVAPREVAINRLERKVSITFQTADKGWQDAVLHSQTITLFDTAARTEDMVINYGGNFAAEPVVTVQALTVGSDGPVPLYYRDVTIYSVGLGGGANGGVVTGNPLLIATGWNTNTLVSGGKMRADGLDITAQLADGTQLARYIGGTQVARKVWIKPHTWPSYAYGTLPQPLDSSQTSMLVNINGNETWQASGKIALDNEIISYSGITITSNAIGSMQYLLSNLTRGVDGTTAAAHVRFTLLKRPATVRISYGYASGFNQVFYNNLNGWPLINYESSNNGEWIQDDTYDPNPVNRPWTWRADHDPEPLRTYENIFAWPESDTKLALYGSYIAGTGGAGHQRLMLPAPGVAARAMTHIRLKFTLKGGQEGYPAITVRLMRYSQTGQTRELWNYTHNSASEAAIDTGYIDALYGMMSPIAYYFIRLDHAANGQQVRYVRLDEFHAKLDQGGGGADFPNFTALGTEGGLGLGEYPVTLTIQNLNDSGNPQAFNIATRMATSQSVSVDCGERNVSGMTLSECSYQNPTWLRLKPGSNTIRFSGTQGAGQMFVTVQWRERF